jgi:hypothetical protein
MNVHWVFLAGALVLLLCPGYTPPRIRSMLKRSPNARWPADPAGLASLPINWIDLARGLCGTFLLLHSFSVKTPHDPKVATQIVAAQAGILALGLIIQTVRKVTEIIVVAPLFYLSGMILIYSDPLVGGAAVAIGWAFGVAARKAQLVSFMFCVILFAGHALSARSLSGYAVCALAGLPLVLMFVSGRPFVYLVKNL